MAINRSARWLGRTVVASFALACEDPRPSDSFQIWDRAPEQSSGGTSGGGGNGDAAPASPEPEREGGASSGGNPGANRGGSAGANEPAPADGGGGEAGANEPSSAGGDPATGGTSEPSPGGADGGAGEPVPGEFFGESRCSDELELCEDFEGALDANLWSTMGRSPALDTTRAARGARSAHFQSAENGLMLIRTTRLFPALSDGYYGRLFVWFAALPTAPRWAHWTIAAAQGADETELRVGGQFDGTINRFGVGTDHGPTGDWTRLDQDSDDEVPLERWLCVEWEHDLVSDTTRLWVDEAERPSLQTTADDHGGPDDERYLLPELESVWVGFWQYATGVTPGEFDVWIDEVAFDDERIGCER